MFWLRPILLLAGALFIAALFWWERRRSRQAAAPQSTRAARAEPSFESMPMTVPTSEREPRRALPVIDWPAEAVHAPAGAPIIAPTSAPPAIPLSTPVAAPVAALPPLIVEWPEESMRRIVTLRVVPAGNDRLAGRAVRQALSACGFRHGEFGIFHLPDESGRVILSAASLVLPGTLDPTVMDFQRYSGLNLFAVLPGPLPPEVAFERLAQLALELAGRVSGRVHDDQGTTLGAGNTLAWRKRMLDSLEPAGQGAPAGQVD
ncbi:MAG: hypothetical protein JSR15_06205 [Proteobacteria bacterium]|nr:hypothetical protein [Pseudomonadota bacterium]